MVSEADARTNWCEDSMVDFAVISRESTDLERIVQLIGRLIVLLWIKIIVFIVFELLPEIARAFKKVEEILIKTIFRLVPTFKTAALIIAIGISIRLIHVFNGVRPRRSAINFRIYDLTIRRN